LRRSFDRCSYLPAGWSAAAADPERWNWKLAKPLRFFGGIAAIDWPLLRESSRSQRYCCKSLLALL